MAMLDQLHNEIDRIEAMKNRAKRAAIETVETELPRLLEETGDLVASLVAVAEIVEDRMADLTTEAFTQGVEFSRERRRAADADTTS